MRQDNLTELKIILDSYSMVINTFHISNKFMNIYFLPHEMKFNWHIPGDIKYVLIEREKKNEKVKQTDSDLQVSCLFHSGFSSFYITLCILLYIIECRRFTVQWEEIISYILWHNLLSAYAGSIKINNFFFSLIHILNNIIGV